MSFVPPNRPVGGPKKKKFDGVKTGRSTICTSARSILNQNAIDLMIDGALPRNEAGNDKVAQFFGMIAACVGGTGNPGFDCIRGFGLLLDQPESFLTAISDVPTSAVEIASCKTTLSALCPDAMGMEIASQMRSLRKTHKRTDTSMKKAFWAEGQKFVKDCFTAERSPFLAVTYQASPVAADNFAAAALEEVKRATFKSAGAAAGIAWDDSIDAFDWDPTKPADQITSFEAVPDMFFPKCVGNFKGAWILLSSIIAGVEAKIRADNVVTNSRTFMFESREMKYEQKGVKFVNVAMEIIVEALMRSDSKETLYVGTTSYKYSRNGTLPRVPNVRGRNVVACYLLTAPCRPLRKAASMPSAWIDNIEDILGYIVYTKDPEKVSSFIQTIMISMKMKEGSGPKPKRSVEDRIASLREASGKGVKQDQAKNVVGSAASSVTLLTPVPAAKPPAAPLTLSGLSSSLTAATAVPAGPGSPLSPGTLGLSKTAQKKAKKLARQAGN